MSDTGARRIGFEASHLSVSVFQTLLGLLKPLEPARELITASALLDQVRAVKEPKELEVMERAIATSDQAMDQVTERLRPGMTERDVAWQMELTMRELGADAISFDTIVAAGPNGALPHHRPTDRLITGRRAAW